MLLAAPALAQSAPAADEEATIPGELIISTGGPYRRWKEDETTAPVAQITQEELVHYLGRLPTLADLSKERWNETHRRFDGRWGRPVKRA